MKPKTLILMVVVSYRQVIYAYPQGGGSYVVARENLGLLMGLIAAGIGTAAGLLGGWIDEAATATMDLFISLPWIFAVLIAGSLAAASSFPPRGTVATTFNESGSITVTSLLRPFMTTKRPEGWS